ncbi:hypothetical protein IOD13_12885 [Brevibacterium casei]|nr:hypothetical protein [Brevibacterium casei]
MRTAKELGLTTIVFTDPWMSPGAALADHVLTADVRALVPRTRWCRCWHSSKR